MLLERVTDTWKVRIMPKTSPIFTTLISLAAAVFCFLAIPMPTHAITLHHGGEYGILLPEDIEALEQSVASGPDYEEGDLIAVEVIDVPVDAIDGNGTSPSLFAACTQSPKCQVVLHKIATGNGTCRIDLRCTLASMGTCVRIKGVRGSYTCKDTTSGGQKYTQSFSGSQIVPSGGYTIYVDGKKTFNANHRIWVSWQLTADVYNYAYGSPGYSGTRSL